MTASWYATLFAWLLTGLLILAGFGRISAIAAIAAAAVTAAAIIAGIIVAVRDWFRRATGVRVTVLHRRPAEAPEPAPPLTGMPPVVIGTRPGAGLFCLWCHPTTAGRAGRCGCTEKCKNVDWCIGDYTALGTPEFTAQLERMLHEGGQS